MTSCGQAPYFASEGARASCVASYFITIPFHENSASLFTDREAVAPPSGRRAQRRREPREHGRAVGRAVRARNARSAWQHADCRASRVSPDDPRDQSSDGFRRLVATVVRRNQWLAHRGSAVLQRMNFPTCGLQREGPARASRLASVPVGTLRLLVIALRPQDGECGAALGRVRA